MPPSLAIRSIAHSLHGFIFYCVIINSVRAGNSIQSEIQRLLGSEASELLGEDAGGPDLGCRFFSTENVSALLGSCLRPLLLRRLVRSCHFVLHRLQVLGPLLLQLHLVLPETSFGFVLHGQLFLRNLGLLPLTPGRTPQVRENEQSKYSSGKSNTKPMSR